MIRYYIAITNDIASIPTIEGSNIIASLLTLLRLTHHFPTIFPENILPGHNILTPPSGTFTPVLKGAFLCTKMMPILLALVLTSYICWSHTCLNYKQATYKPLQASEETSPI